MTASATSTSGHARATRTGGRPAIEGVIPGRYALSVGNPKRPAPAGWRWTALTDVARLESGHTPSRRHPEYWGGDIPWIGIRDATENHGRTLADTLQHTNELGIANSSARVLPTNTVCLSRTASVGYVVVMGRPMATSQDFVNWVCSDAIDFRFLKYVLLSEHDSFLSFASGTTHQTIYYPEVKAFHVCCPPLEVQRRIVEPLAALDALIQNNRRRIELLEQMAAAIYREWFIRFRYPGHEDAVLVGSRLGPIPDGWRAGRVDDHLLLQRGFDLPTQDRSPGDIPVVTASGVHGSHSEAKAQGPGVATGRSGTIGVVTYLPADYWPLNTVLWVKEFRLATPLYAYHLLASLDLRVAAAGATVPMLNRNVVHALPVISPPVGLVRDWDALVQPMFAAATTYRRQTRDLAATRDLLLPKLVTGRIDVSKLDLDALVDSVA